MTLAQAQGFLRVIGRQQAQRDRFLLQLILTATRGDAKAVEALDRHLQKRSERS